MRFQLSPYRRTNSWNMLRDFDSFFEGVEPKEEWFKPAADIKETDKAYHMIFDLPGMTDKDISLEYKEGVLSVTGERKRESEKEENGWHRTERFFGKFERRFTLPEGIDADKIEATFKNGVLEVNVPKNGQKTTKQIPIKN